VAFRFSGHETFALRYAWLPKAYRALRRDPATFLDEDRAMVELGLGKNMVRSLRFWVEATGVATPGQNRELRLTDFAHAVFAKDGHDPYLEDQRTLWLLHWNLSTRREGPLFAWWFLLNHWPFPELTRSEALAAFSRESAKLGYSHSSVTLSQHLDAFLHTYFSGRGTNIGVEDSLDGPLVDLNFIQALGERRGDAGRWEPVYAFRRESKPEIGPVVFDYCLSEFCSRFWPGEETVTAREIALGPCSPGQVFKLPEDDIRARLEAYAARDKSRPFAYQPSAVQGLLTRRRGVAATTLADVYAGEPSYV
jgi:hypothetical protein